MPIAYTWQFDSLDVFPTYQTVTDAVESMHWRLTADDGLGHQAQAYGEQKTGPIDVNDFIPYDDLTLADVQGWCETQMGPDLDAVKAVLVGQINEQISPTVVSLPPPW
ncbi:hypothetical protein UFOVP312_4 [uncultured Caudovirales phage]|uniref:DUF7936 domain-containing protein n=1 Tax=uncultured Caudovirales phage TaxID=2100421 RepID=A0A6J5LQE1_9CAUD|nr:hypothetical protein UFOVP312_4 [uncultured Caudovirales phage]